MKTYARKRQQHHIIENVEELCRLCLERNDVMKPIFCSVEGIMYNLLVLRIMMCIGIEVVKDSYLPDMVCLPCYQELERIYSFRKKCEVANRRLKSHVIAMKEGGSNVVTVKEESIQHAEDVEVQQQDDVALDHRDLIIAPKENSLENSKIDDQSSVLPTTTETYIDNHLSAQIRSKLIEAGVLMSTNDVLSWQTSSEQLGEVLLGLVTSDGQFQELELFEEEQESDILNASTEIDTANSIQKQLIVNTTYRPVAQKSKVQICPECGKSFATAMVLRRHQRIHSGERPFSCHHCHLSFSQKEILRRHLLMHLEIKPFKCAQCSKSFTQRSALLSHERSHFPPHSRPLHLRQCKYCTKVFLYASGLSRHMAVSHGKRLYRCELCPRSFFDKSSLTRHFRGCHEDAAPAHT